MNTHVVIEDPQDEFWEGALIDAENAHRLRARGVITLPINPENLHKSAVGGYYRRAWGSGWVLSESVPTMQCPIVLYASPANVPSAGRLNAVLRLVPAPELLGKAREGMVFSGALRLAAYSGQPMAHSGGFSADTDTCVEMAQLGALDERGGWTKQLGGKLHVPADGFFSCALYGAAPGMRVVWIAVSQSG